MKILTIGQTVDGQKEEFRYGMNENIDHCRI